MKDVWPIYAKGNKTGLTTLGADGRLEKAIKHAQLARIDAVETSESNPSTDVDLLVTKLREIAETQFLRKPKAGA